MSASVAGEVPAPGSDPRARAAVSPPRAGAGPRWRPDCALRPRTSRCEAVCVELGQQYGGES